MNSSISNLPVVIEQVPIVSSPEPSASNDAAIRHLTANNMIKNYVIMALTAGLYPSPLVDTVAVTALEVKMISDMAKVYEFPVPHKLVALKVLVSVLSSVGMTYMALQFSSVVKMAPGVGHALHTSLFSISGGAAVYAVGKIFQRHYESGGVFLSSNNSVIRRVFNEEYRQGKKIVPQWAKA